MPRVRLTLTDEKGRTKDITEQWQGGATFFSLTQVSYTIGPPVKVTVHKTPTPTNGTRLGDHVRLMQANQATGTDMICFDPNIADGQEIDLTKMDKGFSGRGHALNFILVRTDPAYARVRLYNQGDPALFPTLVLYSFQGGLINLNYLFFAGKTSHLLFEPSGDDPIPFPFCTCSNSSATTRIRATASDPSPDVGGVQIDTISFGHT